MREASGVAGILFRALGPVPLAVGLCWAVAARADDWPTRHHDAGRSGRSADCVRGPYRLEWVAELPD